MSTPLFQNHIVRLCLLPILLVVITGIVLGCYFETNDDLVIIFMLRGTGMLAPVSNLHLYFHGSAPLLTSLYQLLPALPWYGIFLYALLIISAVLAFHVLDHMTEQLSVSRKIILLIFFFFLTYVEHVLRMNFTRVPILLTGTTLLYLFQLIQQRRLGLGWLLIGTVLIGISWTIRSNGAFLGILVTAPAIFVLPPARWGRAAMLVACYLILALAGSAWLTLGVDGSQRAYEHLSNTRASINDYQLYTFHPSQPTDYVAIESIQTWWGIGDTTLVNRQFYQRTTQVDLTFWGRNVIIPKTQSLIVRLASDYFLYAVVNGLLVILLARSRAGIFEQRRGFLYGVFMVGLLLALGILLQLPPRVASPMLTLFTLVNLGMVLPHLNSVRWATPGFRNATIGLFIAVSLGFAAKMASRAFRHRKEQQQNEFYLAQLAKHAAGRPLVVASLYNSFRSLSPFRNYNLGGGLIYSLNGWTATDPSQLAVLHNLTGPGSYSARMAALARRPEVVWAFPPRFASFFSRYLAATSTISVPTFCPTTTRLPDPALADLPQLYTPCHIR